MSSESSGDDLLGSATATASGLNIPGRSTGQTSNSATSSSGTILSSSAKPPGGPAAVIRRKAASLRTERVANTRPNSTRAAGAGGSSSTMLKLYTDDSPGLSVDPVVVMVLSISFIASVIMLHVLAKITRYFMV